MFTNILVSEKIMFKRKRGKEYYDFTSIICCPTVRKKLPRWNFLCFTFFLERESFMEKKVGGREGVSFFSVENLLAHSTERLCSGNLLCLRFFLSSKKNYS